MQEQSIVLFFFFFTDKVLEVKNIDSKGGTQQSVSKILSEEQTSDGHLEGNSPPYRVLRSHFFLF